MSTQTLQPPIEARPEFAGILREEETFASGAGDDSTERINGWFDRLMMQCGLELSPSVLLMLCVCGGVALGGLAFVVSENLWWTARGAGVGFPLPVAAAVVLRHRRQMRILHQLPEAVGELARAARTGRSLEQCFQLVAADTKAPLGHELRQCARRLEMGMPLPLALRELPARTGLVSVSVLLTALAVHHKTGGDLVKVLDRLARTIRDRMAYLGRMRAATAASRATAVLMVSLPPLILAFFLWREPGYFNELTESELGRGLTLGAIVLQVIGTVWVLRILKKTKRG
ncbi:MAG: type II secretion system F family protein [Planctomycetaceae bacterium]